MNKSFDQYADRYDVWFMANPNVLLSEVRLVANVLKDSGRVLSVGCGSGLFESILAKEYDIHVKDGIEPAEPMAEIARKRGMSVTVATAEDADFGDGIYDTILFNGSPGYITDLRKVVNKAYKALRPNGKLILIDVPKESGYGTLYNLAKTLGTWEHPMLKDVAPKLPYPIEFVSAASWRTTAEKSELMLEAGFKDISYMQTLTTYPLKSDLQAEEPLTGCDKGSYVATTGVKRAPSK